MKRVARSKAQKQIYESGTFLENYNLRDFYSLICIKLEPIKTQISVLRPKYKIIGTQNLNSPVNRRFTPSYIFFQPGRQKKLDCGAWFESLLVA